MLPVDSGGATGASAEAIAKLTAEMEAFEVQYTDSLFRLPMTLVESFPVGVLVSLVSAGLHEADVRSHSVWLCIASCNRARLSMTVIVSVEDSIKPFCR